MTPDEQADETAQRMNYSFEDVEENANPLNYFDEEGLEVEKRHERYLALSKKRNKKLNRLFSTKEIFDRIGYGFAAHQFITIFFFLIGASAFLVGTIHAFRNVLSDFFSSFFREFSQEKRLSNQFISTAGIVFGFSFFGLLLGIRIQSKLLFALSLLVGSIGVVTYGELYSQLLNEGIKHERRSWFLRRIAHYGLIITAIAFLFSGFLLEFIGMGEKTVVILGLQLPVSGYFLIFEIAAIAFIISGFILSRIPVGAQEQSRTSWSIFLKRYVHELHSQTKLFFSSKHIYFLYIGALLITVIEALGASFYGYYIFTLFRNQLFGGFFNVAVIFSIAILISFLGPFLITKLTRHIGLAPLFVFGTLLLAMTPLSLVFNPYFITIIVAVSLTVLGSSILGVAQSLLARKLLSPSQRKTFFTSLQALLIVPFFVLAVVGSLVAWLFSFITLFKVVLFVLIFIIAPLYFALVIISNRKRL